MSRKTNDRLDVAKVMEDFQKSEKASSRRNGTFKIDRPFEDALNVIVKAKPETTKRKEKGR
jgi:hypothetical protein